MRPFSGIAALVLILRLVPAASAQVVLTHVEDAAPVPRGMVRVTLTNVWTRYDERFIPGGKQTLGQELSVDSLGSAQYPALVPVEQGLRTLANDPRVRLSLGRLLANSDARIVTTPIAFEYGVTRRFSIGFVIPIVQTRRNIQLTVNPDSQGNMSWLPERLRTAAANANATVFTAFRSAADSLGILLARCPTSPGSAGCGAVNANPSGAAAARLQAQQFADALNASLGTDETHTLVAPRSNSALAKAIDVQRVAINLQIQQFLGAGAGTTTATYTTGEPFSYIDFQGRNGIPGFLQSPLGGNLDSITTLSRFGTGDIELGAQYLLIDRYSRDTLPVHGIQARLAIAGAFRFPTSVVDSTTSTLGIPTGDGAGFNLRSTMDVLAGHFSGTLSARYVKSFAQSVVAPLIGDPEAPFPAPEFGPIQRTAGSVFSLDATPRLQLDDWLSIDAHYGLDRIGPTTFDRPVPTTLCTGCETIPPFVPITNSRTTQRLGLGLRYSTEAAFARGTARYPVQVSFVHLQTITGADRLPVLSQDQIQVRLYFKVLNNR